MEIWKMIDSWNLENLDLKILKYNSSSSTKFREKCFQINTHATSKLFTGWLKFKWKFGTFISENIFVHPKNSSMTNDSWNLDNLDLKILKYHSASSTLLWQWIWILDILPWKKHVKHAYRLQTLQENVSIDCKLFTGWPRLEQICSITNTLWKKHVKHDAYRLQMLQNKVFQETVTGWLRLEQICSVTNTSMKKACKTWCLQITNASKNVFQSNT